MVIRVLGGENVRDREQRHCCCRGNQVIEENHQFITEAKINNKERENMEKRKLFSLNQEPFKLSSGSGNSNKLLAIAVIQLLFLPSILISKPVAEAAAPAKSSANSNNWASLIGGPQVGGASGRQFSPTSPVRMHLEPFSEKQMKQQMNKPPLKALKRVKRQTPCRQGEELDDYVDQLFRFGTRIVRAMEPVTLPNATIELPDQNIKIFLYEGKGTRAYKFKRTKSAWVYCSNETISLGLTIEVEQLRVAYKYRVISGNRLIFDGDLEAQLSPKIQAQFSQAVQEEDSEEPVQQRIDRIRVFRLGKVTVVIRGLGNLTQSLSMIINGYLNDNQEELQPTFRMVEGDIVRFANRALANVNVPLLSVV